MSAWDQQNFVLYFQGHYMQDDAGSVSMSSLTLALNRETGNLNYYVDTYLPIVSYGYTGYQFVTYLNTTAFANAQA